MIYQDLFRKAGLSENESIIYEYLLKNGQSPAAEIIKKTPLNRGVVYNTLADLKGKELIDEIKMSSKGTKGISRISVFIPNHPEKLRSFVEEQEMRIEKARKELEASMSVITSDFNLSSGKPGIRYFEGVAGIRKVIADTFSSKETIYAYLDIEALVKYTEDINKEYVKRRENLHIKKRGIVVDSPFARNYLKGYFPDTTESRFINSQSFPFNSVLQIYDDKVSYVSFSPDQRHIALLIEDRNIYRMHRSLYELTWENAKTLDQLPPFSNAI